MILISLCVIIIAACESANSARILGIVPTPSYSHQIVFRPIWRELSKRGHDVVIITTDPENDPNLNLTEIDISFAYDLWTQKNIFKQLEEFYSNPVETMKSIQNAAVDICTWELSHPEVQTLLKNDTEHFDLIIVELIFPVMLGFVERFKCPFIAVRSRDIINFYHSTLGNHVHSVLYPDLTLPFSEKLTFWQRLKSVLYDVLIIPSIDILSGGIVENGAVHKLVQDQFGKDMPPLVDIMKNFSMMFLNVDPSFYTRPLGPAVIAIGGGTHLISVKPLPKDLQEYLDGAKNGVIYFSLGTNVKSVMIPPEMRKIMLDTFKELPYRVLWKFDVLDIPDVPENVKIVNWLPQQDILRHPNIKLFITQGGLQSMEEAVFSHVPVVGMPFVGDQEGNVNKIVRKGFGVYVDKNKLTKESFKAAILEVINNPKYKQNIVEAAELSRDQPMTGLEKAVWWTEYVIRHKGARNLRSPAIDLPTYQYYFLDVIGFLLAVISVLLFIIYKTIVLTKKLILYLFKSKSNEKVKRQ